MNTVNFMRSLDLGKEQALLYEMMESFYVYTFIDKDTDEIIYIGQTSDIMQRLTAHRGNKKFNFDNITILLREVYSKKEAEKIEMQMIKRYKPTNNIMGKPIDGINIRIRRGKYENSNH